MEKQAGKVSDVVVKGVQKVLQGVGAVGGAGGALKGGVQALGRTLKASSEAARKITSGEAAAEAAASAKKAKLLARLKKWGLRAGAGAAATGGVVGLGSLMAGGGKKKKMEKKASAFVNSEFNGFMDEMAKLAGYKADKEKGEGSGKPKAGKAAASPTPPGGTKNPGSASIAPVAAGGKGGAAHKSDPDDEEGYD